MTKKKQAKELYRKHRPKTLDEMMGNKATIKTLQNFIAQDKLPHCLLFTGATGCGKTTLARILKNELDVDPNFGWHELDASQFRGIDTARDLNKQAWHKPMTGQNKIMLLDEVHNFGVGGASEKNLSQNAILKTLENCPDWCYFILCTTNPEMLIPTLKGRCVELTVSTLSDKEMMVLVKRIAAKEKKTISNKMCKLIATNSYGHPRNALQILESVLILDDEAAMEKVVQRESQKKSGVNELAYALLDDADWPRIAQIIRNLFKAKVDPESIRRSIMGMMQSGILTGWAESKAVDPLTILEVFVQNPTFNSGAPAIVYCCRKLWNDNGSDA